MGSDLRRRRRGSLRGMPFISPPKKPQLPSKAGAGWRAFRPRLGLPPLFLSAVDAAAEENITLQGSGSERDRLEATRGPKRRETRVPSSSSFHARCAGGHWFDNHRTLFHCTPRAAKGEINEILSRKKLAPTLIF